MVRWILWGALATAALLHSQPPASSDELASFLQLENKEQVLRMLGSPKAVADFGPDFQSWQYEIGRAEDEEFTHIAVIRKSTGALVSITRHFERQRNVDELFPPASTVVCSYPDAKAAYRMRVRTLAGGRLLIAMGSAEKGQPTGQLVLIRRTDLPFFFPWLESQLPAR